MNDCFPNAKTRAQQALDLEDPCKAVAILRAQLYSAMTGNTTRTVRDGDRWRETHSPNIKELRAEIRRLEVLCGSQQGQHGRAIRVGPYRYR